jgi:protein-histidine pros-kinase
LIAAVKWQAGEICSGAKLALAENYPDVEPPISSDTAITIFRIAQEALTNIVKHARATHVNVTLMLADNRLVLQIEDDGVGIATDWENLTGAHGIAGMKHRLKSHGGKFKLEQKTPQGTRLVASLPLPTVSNSEQTRLNALLDDNHRVIN